MRHPSDIAAAAGSMVRSNSTGQYNSPAWKAMNWSYRNVCWYGIQIQRQIHRIFRLMRHVLSPVGSFFLAHIGQPLFEFGESVSAIASDTKSALGQISKAKSSGGIKAMASAASNAAAHGAVKHKTFLATAVNYSLPVISIFLLLTVAFSLFSRDYALAVEVDGLNMGYISDESTYTEATELIGERVISTSEEFKSALTPSYSLVSIKQQDFLKTSEELCNTILLNSDDVEEAYGLFVDNKLIGALRSEGDMSYILGSFLEKYRTGAANESITLVGENKIVSGLYATEKIMDSESFRDFIGATKKETEVYTIKSGDTLSGILNKFKLSEERFYELNEGFAGNLVSGKTLLVESEKPVLNVQNVIVSSYEKTIAYSTETIKDSSKYTNYKNTQTKGVNGTEKVTEQTVYIDGVQVSKKVIGRETIKKPVNEVIVVGTKKITTTKYNSGGKTFNYTASDKGGKVGTGRFTWPVPGVNTVSSRYGYRWGRLHSGIDISTSGVYGRTIVAADSGTVTSVRNSPSGYGLHLIISHGNGYSTLYGHCSAILVSAGDKVSKGQAIAKVGNSGRSTGPHLHFEIRVNGSAKDPLKYY